MKFLNIALATAFLIGNALVIGSIAHFLAVYSAQTMMPDTLIAGYLGALMVWIFQIPPATVTAKAQCLRGLWRKFTRKRHATKIS